MPKVPSWDDTEEISSTKPSSTTPKWEDTMDIETEKPSEIEALLRGAASGATFEFSDEAAAAIESALTGKPYKQALAESRAAYKAAREEQPELYTAGQIAGGIGSTFIPGLGAVGNVGKATTLLGKIGAGALAGATTGALTGLGATEAPILEKPKEAAKDILEMATYGAAGGAAIPAAVAGVKGIGSGVKKLSEPLAKGAKEFYEGSPMLKEAATMMKIGEQGKKITNLDKEYREAASSIVDDLFNIGKSSVVGIDDAAKIIDDIKGSYPEFDLKSLIKKLEQKTKSEDYSEEVKDNVKDFIYTLKNAAITTKKQGLVPTGKVIPGTIEKATEKVESKLAKERRLIEKDLTENLVNLQKVEKDSPEYAKLLEKRKDLQANLAEIEAKPRVVTTPEGQFIEGVISKPKTIEKVISPNQQLLDKLISEKAALQKQIELAEQKVQGELSPALAEEALAPLNKRLAEIDSELSAVQVPEMGAETLTATLRQPQLTEEGGITLGKTIAAPVKKVTEEIPGREIVEPLPSKIIGEYSQVKPGQVEVMKKPTLTSVEARELQKNLYKEYYDKLRDMPPAAKDTFWEIMENVKDGVARGDIDAREMFDKANQAFADVKELYKLVGFDPMQIEGGMVKSEAFDSLEKAKVITDLARKMQKLPEWELGISAGEAQDTYKKFIDAFKLIDPTKAEQIDQKVKDISQRYNLGLKSSVRNLLGGSQGVVGFLLGGREAVMLKGAYGLGKLKRFIKGKPELLGTEKLSATKVLTNLTNDELAQLSNETSGNTKTLLEKISQSSDRGARNALIFTALQRPEVRKELELNEEENK